LPNTNINYQAERFKAFLVNNYNSIKLKVLAMRFFLYQGPQQNISAYANFIVDKFFDPEERRPFQQESQALEILRRVSLQNINRRTDIRAQRVNFDRETERYNRMTEEYNALRNTYRENVNNYNRTLRENILTDIDTIRENAHYIPNGEHILAEMNTALEGSNIDAERHTIVGYAMTAIQTAITQRERETETAELERISRVLAQRERQINRNAINVSILCTETAHELQQHHDCPICYGDEVRSIEIVTTGCNHEFCAYCISRHIEERTHNQKACCPMCRTEISSLSVKDVELHGELTEKFS